MSRYDFIFSEKIQHRVFRHVAFWLLLAVHFFIQNLLVGTANEALKPRTTSHSLTTVLYFLPFYIISTYVFIYFIIPHFLYNRRYTTFYILTAGLLIFNIISCYVSGVFYIHSEWHIPYELISFEKNKYHAIVNGLFLPIMVLGIASGIVLSKKWFQKQRENEKLVHQIVASELRLLKTQINPRFLFHSLHTVKQHILINSPRAPELILQISDLLSYILYESAQDLILLTKELEIVKAYLALEENGSSGRLKATINISGNAGTKYITPLLVLSVVEATLEFVLEVHERKILYNLLVEVKGSRLYVNIDFDKDHDHNYSDLTEKLNRIHKQLNTLYPGNHRLNFDFTQGTSIILLQMPILDRASEKDLTSLSKPGYETVSVNIL